MMYHCHLSVRGYLRYKGKKWFKNLFQHEDGTPLSPEQARNYLLDQLSNGHEALSLGKCDNFDKKTGCKGHKED